MLNFLICLVISFYSGGLALLFAMLGDSDFALACITLSCLAAYWSGLDLHSESE